MTALEFVVLALACFRVTRLIVLDTITDPLRDLTVYRLPDSGFAGYVKVLFDCPWCVGFWVSIGGVIAWAIDSEVTWWLSLPFAISSIVGLLARNLDSDP